MKTPGGVTVVIDGLDKFQVRCLVFILIPKISLQTSQSVRTGLQVLPVPIYVQYLREIPDTSLDSI